MFRWKLVRPSPQLVRQDTTDFFTEKFDQAVNDYTTGLNLKQELLPLSSRHIAEAHYRLCLVLDMTPGQLAAAISHVEKALQSVEARIEELRVGPQQRSAPPSSASDSKGKGKGKAVASSLLKGDSVQDLSPQEIESELKEMDELRSDLMLKVHEFYSFALLSHPLLNRSKN